MNKRQRKKKNKKVLGKWYIGIDMASGQDYSILHHMIIPHTIAEQIYKEFCIPEQIINNRAKEIHLQYSAYMNLHRLQT